MESKHQKVCDYQNAFGQKLVDLRYSQDFAVWPYASHLASFIDFFFYKC